jgi:hypothetical protein
MKTLFGVLIIMFSFFSASISYAQSIVMGQDRQFTSKTLKVPYAFYNESYGAAAGFVYGVTGAPQDQATILATVMGGTHGSYTFFAMERDIQIPFLKRLFVDADLMAGHYGELRSYTDGNPRYADERAGSNDSHKDDYIDGDGHDYLIRLKLKYLLPIGHGRDDIISTQVLERGLLSSGEVGGTSWNPLKSGKTYFETRFYARDQEVDSRYVETDQKSRAFELALFWENTDFPYNPSRGNTLRLRFARDWGGLDSTAPWSVLDGELTKYFSLGPSEKFRQRTLVLDIWTADALTWDSSHTEGKKEVYHRPPAYAGATLGGLFRMRGFPLNRFNDQAAIYYCGEYRMTPKWNPFADISWVQEFLEIAWWQWVPFVEVGRVAPTWSINELHTDMQWDVGFGIRAIAKGLVVRIDTAVSEEDFGVQMMVGHPFQF